jgi:hypothetical protein
MLKLINSSKGMGRVSLHEYVLGGTTLNDVIGADPFNPATWPATVPKSQRWTLGRYQWWVEDAASRGIPFPDFFVTEWGWATRPDMAHEHIRNVMQTWPVGDREGHMELLLAWAWNVLYKPSPKFKGAMLFTLNDGGQWDFSNYLHFPRARELMRKGFEMTILPSQPTPVYTPKPLGHYILSGDGVRIRAAADTSAEIVKTLYNGAQVSVMSTAVIINDGYGWQEIECGEWRGFMALHGSGVTWSLSPVPVTPQPEPVTREQLTAWADTLQTVVDDMRAKAATL